MKYVLRLLLPRLLLSALFLVLLPLHASAFGWPNTNDSIFPPLPAARASIHFDGKGFIIHGRRTFIVAGDMHYPRTPRALWRDRLLRIKRAGYNTVQTYAFWNYHEPREGQFDFTGEKDLNAFLALVQLLGMYAIVRAGPYINAEWDTGGLPVWLRFKPGLLPMTDNAPFYAAVEPYWNKLLPIIAANQISRGGPVIMVQLENEHVLPDGVGGGTDLPNAYYRHYLARARRAGLTIPLFFSGLNHNDDPAGDEPFDISQRTSPWYSTEFWTGWVARYGVEPARGKKLERATWKVIAYGGAGYTHYTMAGGTDFDTWNNDEQAAAYDFGSPIGQAGDLRDDYYACKRAAMFATAFAPVLSNSLPAAGGGGAAPTDGSIQITNRKGPEGEILFLDNRTGEPVKTRIRMPGGTAYPAAGPVTLAPGEIMPVVRGFPLLPGVNLTLSAARILGVAQSGSMTTLVVYGTAGEPAELHFAAHAARAVQQPASGKALVVMPGLVLYRTAFPSGAPSVSIFQVGRRLVRILAMRSELADRCWFLHQGSLIAVGPDYVGEVRDTPAGLRIETERRGLGAALLPALPRLLYMASTNAPTPLVSVPVPGARPAPVAAPALSAWRVDASDAEAQGGYNDTGWKASDQPLPMGADGDYSAYAWYRSALSMPKAGTYQLNLSDVGDWVVAFVNGKRADSDGPRTRYRSAAPRRLVVPLQQGRNTLALLTAHYGRNKLFNYYGRLDVIDAKGVSGPATVSAVTAAPPQVTAFRWQADDRAPDDAAKQAAVGVDTSGADWHDATSSTDVFNDRYGWAWFRADLPAWSGPHRSLHFDSIDDSGTIYLNGKLLASDIGINADADISLDPAWNEKGPNVLAVAVHNTGGPGTIGEVRLVAPLPEGQAVRGWRMRGGVALPAWGAASWKEAAPRAAPATPAFYAATFKAVPPGPVGPHPVLRLSTAGMSRGFVWLNGRNLGRYPEKSPVEGVYLPESLLKPGGNHLIVFDEDGSAPAGMHIIVEAVASRVGAVLAPSSALHTASR